METRHIALGDLDVAYLTTGPDDGPLALLLHGYPDTPWAWRHLAPVLADRGYRVVAPFLRGYAPTGLAPDGCYQPGALVADAIALRRALGDHRPALLVGHDWGAIAAYGAAVHAPALWDRVVTMAVPPLGTARACATRCSSGSSCAPAGTWASSSCRGSPSGPSPGSSRGCGPTGRPATTPGRTSRGCSRPFPTRRTARPRCATTGPGPSRGASSPATAARSAPSSACPPSRCSTSSGPTTGASGPEASRLAAGLCETVEVPGAGHFLAVERPDAVAAAVTAFLER